MATLWVSPSGLPRMDFSKGIPEQARTLVVVPTMLSSERGVDDLVEALEVRYLANSGASPAFRLVDRFPRRAAGGDRARRAIAAAGPEGHRAVECEIFDRGTGPLLPFPSAALLECARAEVDGLRTQARQARRSQRAAARRRPGKFLAAGRRHRDPDRRQVRDHPGYRQPVATRYGRAVDRRDGASAEPAAMQSGDPHGRPGLRHPAAAHRHQPAEHGAIQLLAPVRQRGGRRSLYAHGLGRLPGCFPGRCPSSAKASTTWTPSNSRSPAASSTTVSSATT